MPIQRKSRKAPRDESGRLRIGDNWNAITIIALSQNNPLKAIAEFVENSIDARAKAISIIRGKAKGQNYLKIIDDGQGVPLDEKGTPNFKYVATHICDSIKKKLKEEGAMGIQGEFGIGLLSFWTVGETLSLSCCGHDGSAYHMRMSRGQPGYSISHRHLLVPFPGTELVITSLLPGLRQVNGEKIQRYLASELRDRIRQTEVKIKVIDHFSRAEYWVEPRQFSGQLIHQLPASSTPHGEIYSELYFNSPDQENRIGLYRSGTRVLPSLTQLDEFNSPPWTSGYLQGIIDAPFLNLTPGTRDGIIRDERFAQFCEAVRSLQDKLIAVIEEQRRAQEERSSKQILKTVQMALKEAILSLPQEEYDWFEVHTSKTLAHPLAEGPLETSFSGREDELMIMQTDYGREATPVQKDFFEFSGPLHSVKISPTSCQVAVNGTRNLRAVCRDRQRRMVEQQISFQWEILEGRGTLNPIDGCVVTFQASDEPGLTRLRVKVRQNDIECRAEGQITVTESILPENFLTTDASQKGLPGYTLKSAAGENWRSRYDIDQNVVIIT